MKTRKNRESSKIVPLVSFVIVNYNGEHFLEECLGSLAALNYPKEKQEVIVVDNGSEDGSLALLRTKYPRVSIFKNDVNNYCRALNLGVQKAKGEFIASVNNDVRLNKNWLLELVKAMQQDATVGVAGGKIRFFDNKIQSAGHEEYPGFYWGDRGFKEEDRGQYDKIEEVESLCGAAILFRKSCLEAVGPFDEDFIMYLEDVDICLRCKKKKWKVLYVPRSLSRHHFSGTSSAQSVIFFSERNRLLLLAKHFPRKLSDALYGRGYFSWKEGGDEGANIYDVLPLIFSKLLETQNVELVNKITPELFKNVDFINNLEKSILMKRLEESKGSLAAREAVLAKLQQDYASTTAQFERIHGELAAKSVALVKLDQDYAATTAQFERMRGELNVKGVALAKLEHDHGGMNVQLGETRKELDVKSLALAKLEHDYGEMNAQLREAREGLNVKSLASAMLEQDCTAMTAQLGKAREELSAKGVALEKLQRDHAMTTAQLGKTSEELNAKGVALAGLEQDYAEMNEQLRGAREELNVKSLALAKLEQDHAASHAQLGKTREELSAKASALKQVEQEHSEMNAQLGRAREELHEKSEALSKLEWVHGETKAQLGGTQEELHAKGAALSKLEWEHGELRAQLGRTQAELNTKGAALSKLEREHGELRAQLGRTQAELNAKNEALSKLDWVHGETKAQLGKTREELMARSDAFSRLEKEHGETNAQLKKSQEALDAKSTELAKSEQDHAATNAHLKETREELNAKIAALSRSEQDRAATKAQLEKAQEELSATNQTLLRVSYELQLLIKDWERVGSLDKKMKYLIIKPYRVSAGGVEMAANAIKRKYPQALIHLLANPLKEEKESLSKIANIDKKIFNPSGKGHFSAATILKLLFSFWFAKYDVAITLEPSAKDRDYQGYRKAKMLALLSGAKAACTCQIE